MGGQSSKETHPPQQTSIDSATCRLNPFIKKLKESCHDITEDHFMNVFSSEGHPLAKRIYKKLSREEGDFAENAKGSLSYVLVMEALADKVTFYLSLYESQEGTLNDEDLDEFVQTAFTLFLTNIRISHEVSQVDQNTLKSVRTGLGNSILDANNYIQTNCPGLIYEMHCWLTRQITCPGVSESTQGVDFIDGPQEADGQLLNTASWWMFTCSLPSLYTSVQSISNPLETEKAYFMPLYNSSEHGQSMNRFQHHVLAYRGPTVTLIAFHDHLIAVALDTEWRECAERIGGVNCVCMSLTSKYEIIEEGAGMVMFNVHSRNVTKGISIGRNYKNPVLSIDSGMEDVTYKMEKYVLKTIEVWGCGGENAKLEQDKQKQRELRDAERNLKVKRPGRWDDNPDRYLLEMGGVKVSHAES